MNTKTPLLVEVRDVFIENKENILLQWVSYESPKSILELHQIDVKYFVEKYASGVFDYFMGVIAGEREVGNCPVMQELLAYLKFREISADELFEICSHFRRSMVDFSYDERLNSKELFDEISYLFDKNFRGILKFYTDTIFQKLIDARQEALRASQAKEYFLSNMSHEIRTPLNAILGFVNLLIDEELSQKQRNYLDIILNSGENLLSIINDILDFSKLRSGEFTIEPKLFSLHEELSHTMELFVASANLKEITITAFIDPKIPCELYGDILRIKQILSNFLSNAIKFTPEGGVIHVEAHCHNQMLHIEVQDNGIGIDEEDIENIFSAFAQAQFSEHANINGTGLGLSISSQLAELMGGHVDVKSQVAKGSTFWLEVPIEVQEQECEVVQNIQEYQKLKIAILVSGNTLSFKHQSFLRYAEVFDMNVSIINSVDETFDVCLFIHEECDKTLQEKIIKSQKMFIAMMSREYDDYHKYPHIVTLSFPIYCSKIHRAFDELLYAKDNPIYNKKIAKRFSGHILIAEDNEANQELIKIILTKYGLSFDLASNGLEAVELYKQNNYDLILMDEQMPVMDGIEAVRNIIAFEEQQGRAHTPISALTANVIKGAKERGLLSGFDAFLGKPVVLKDLERVFQSYLKEEAYIAPQIDLLEEKESKRIVGLDMEQLMKELMLNEDELVMLLTLFLKKMNTTIPQLQEAIAIRDYEKIALLAHSIKGSSGNFRIEVLQKQASEMEKMAKERVENYDYEATFMRMKEKIESIKIL